MSIDDDIMLFKRIPTLRLLGSDALRMLAIGSEQRDFVHGDTLFKEGDEADAGFVVRHGTFRVAGRAGAEITVGPGTLIGELAMVVPTKRSSTVIALQRSSVVRISRSMFQRVLENDPAAARRLRDEFAIRSSQIVSDFQEAGTRLII